MSKYPLGKIYQHEAKLMATQYTDILKLALPVQGELTGTWGDTVNDEITSMVEQAIAGRTTVTSWTANSHTLTVIEGATSESRAAILNITDPSTSLTGAGTVICPTQSKIYIVENNTVRTITVKTSAGTGISIPSGLTGLIFCDGTNVEDGLTYLPYDNSSSGLTATNVQAAIDELDTAVDLNTASRTALGTPATTGIALLNDETANDARTTLGLGTAAVVDASAYGASLIDDADATAARTTLGISTFGSSLIDDADASAARTTLGLGTAAVVDASAYGASLIDDADASAARTTLGLGTAAVKDVDNMGSLGFASGTEGNPSIARTNNAETGIFFPNNDQIGFSTSGVEKMRILSNGNIDIKSTQETALTIRNLALNASSNSGTTSIKLGDSSNSTKMISREKNATNISSINLFGEFGFGTSVKVYSGSNDSSTFFTSGTQRLQITFNGALILAGSTAQKASGTTWSNPSDIRLKKNITDYGKGIAELMQIRVCEWEFNGLAGTELGLYGIGVIADEAEEVLPKTVDTYEAKLNEDDEEVSDIKKFDATEITWLLVNSVKQHQLVIEQLTARLEALEGA